MKHLVLPRVVLVLLSSLVGCDKPEAPVAPLTYAFQLVNDHGQEATVFPHGQNILFRFLLINPTSQDVVIQNPAFDNAAFLAVQRATPGEGSANVGKPYRTMFCEYQRGFRLAAHDTLELAIPWVEDAARPAKGPFCAHAPTTWLPLGRYRTAFPVAVTLLRDNRPTVTAAQTFSREFEVH